MDTHVRVSRAPLKTSIPNLRVVVWCVKSLSAILKYVTYSAVVENSFPANQQRLEVLGDPQ